MRIPRTGLGAVAALLAVLSGCAVLRPRAGSDGRLLTGHVTVDEARALPRGAVVQLALTDLSRGEGADAVVARYGIRTQGGPRFRFALRIDSIAFDPGHRYGIAASILDPMGRPFFPNDMPHPVLPGETADVEIAVHRVATDPPAREWWEGGQNGR